jgi:hypothetical protein
VRDELLKKIAGTLTDGTNAEKDVVYLLVEIRKLMDRDKFLDPVIRSFTNWVVHVELGQEHEGTTDLLKEFDEVVRLRKEENRGSLFPPHCSFENFRRNLGCLFDTYALPSKLIENERSWMTFARLYSLVVSDCPIKFTASKEPLKHVREIVLKKPDAVKEGPHIEFLEWQVTLTDGQVEHHSIMLM